MTTAESSSVQVELVDHGQSLLFLLRVAADAFPLSSDSFSVLFLEANKIKSSYRCTAPRRVAGVCTPFAVYLNRREVEGMKPADILYAPSGFAQQRESDNFTTQIHSMAATSSPGVSILK